MNEWMNEWMNEKEPCQTSNMERFAKIVNGSKPVTIFAKRSSSDASQGSEYASKNCNVSSKKTDFGKSNIGGWVSKWREAEKKHVLRTTKLFFCKHIF